MSYIHAVITIDQQKALIAPFDADGFETLHVKSHHHDTPQHNSDVRDAHEFFAEVSDKLKGLEQVLITGSHKGLSDFKHYVEKHRPEIAKRVIGYEVVDHPTEAELVAFARTAFDQYHRLAH
jgi:stalled ribosome rescue protein Dom34